MDRDTELRLIDQALDLLARPDRAGDDAAHSVPVSHYTDPRRFAREMEVLFRGGPVVAGASGEIAGRGDFVTRDLFGTPTVLVRDDSGRARAFINVCRHRGATLEKRESGRCKRFVCPYHAWTYRTDGTLASVRHAEGFPGLDVGEIALAELPCAEAGGLLWVHPTRAEDGGGELALDSETEALAAELTGLVGDSRVVARSSHVWDANWKLIVDGGLESYHFRIAHRETVSRLFVDTRSTYSLIGDHVRTVLPKVTLAGLRDEPRDAWQIRPHTHLVYALYPNATVLLQAEHFDLILMTPLNPSQTHVQIMTLVPDPGPDGFSEKARGYWEANHAFTRKTLDEDFSLAADIQRGIHTGANQSFRFATFEGALTAWHRRIDVRLDAG